MNRLKPDDPFLALVSLFVAVVIAAWTRSAQLNQANVKNKTTVKTLPAGK